jgi:hypothetical protein
MTVNVTFFSGFLTQALTCAIKIGENPIADAAPSSEELSLVGPFRDQSLDRPKRLQELTDILKSGAHSLDERIGAIRELTALASGDDAGRGIRAIMEFVERPEAGKERGLRKHVAIDVIWMHGLEAVFRWAKRGVIEDRKTILKQVIRLCLNQPRRIALVRLEEDWPAEDPHRVAPYLIDPNRVQRLLLGELILQLTEGLGYDPRSYEDHELYNRISHARQILQANELAVRNYLKQYDPRPDRPGRFAWLRNLLIPSARKALRGKRLAAVLQEFRDLYARLPGRPEIIFRHYPFAYDTSQAPKRLESTGSSSAPPSHNTSLPGTSNTTETPERKDSDRK